MCVFGTTRSHFTLFSTFRLNSHVIRTCQEQEAGEHSTTTYTYIVSLVNNLFFLRSALAAKAKKGRKHTVIQSPTRRECKQFDRQSSVARS